MHLNVKSDITAALSKLDRIGAEVKAKVTVRALNKTASYVKTQASREIRAAGYELKAKTIKAAIKLRRASAGHLEALVKAMGKPVPLIEFDARQVRDGVSYTLAGQRKMAPHAFIVTSRTGKKGVYVRVGNKHIKTVTHAGKTV